MAAITFGAMAGANSTFLMKPWSAAPNTAAGRNATITPSAKLRESFELPNVIRTSQKRRQYTATTARIAPNWITIGKTSPGG